MKLMWNRQPVPPILIDDSPLMRPDGDTATPAFESEGWIYDVPVSSAMATPVGLPALSWQHSLYNIPEEAK